MQGVHYFVRVSAFNVKGWGPPQCSTPASAAPSGEHQELQALIGRGHATLKGLHYFITLSQSNEITWLTSSLK